MLVHHVGAGVLDVPVELDTRRLEDAAGRLRQLRTVPSPGIRVTRCAVTAADDTYAPRVPRSGTVRGTGCREESDERLQARPRGRRGRRGRGGADREGGALRYRGVDIEELSCRTTRTTTSGGSWSTTTSIRACPIPSCTKAAALTGTAPPTSRPRPPDWLANEARQAERGSRTRRPASTSRGSRPR